MAKRNYPPHTKKPTRSPRTGRLVCGCGKGYASEFDGLCFNCRGETAYDAQRRAAQLSIPSQGGANKEEPHG